MAGAFINYNFKVGDFLDYGNGKERGGYLYKINSLSTVPHTACGHEGCFIFTDLTVFMKTTMKPFEPYSDASGAACSILSVESVKTKAPPIIVSNPLAIWKF